MGESPGGSNADAIDVGEFCRKVEEHLTRVNEGHLVRLVGPSFELVREWARAAMPLSVVFHGIDLKAERHRAGKSKRPLRLEFCEHDVRDVYTAWLRSVGLNGPMAAPAADAEATRDDTAARPSLSKHLDRAADRLSRVAGKMDLPDDFRDGINRLLEAVLDLRETGKGARGPARAEIAAQLEQLDDALIEAARAAVGHPDLERFRTTATADLASYRGRLSADVWERTIDLAVNGLLRAHLGLPTLTIAV